MRYLTINIFRSDRIGLFLLLMLFMLLMETRVNALEDFSQKNCIGFIENKGQVVDMHGNLRPDILYVGDGGGSNVYLRKTGVSYVLTKYEGAEEDYQEPGVKEAEPKTIKLHRVDMDFVGCNTNATLLKQDKVDGYTNYYYAHCPNGIANVTTHKKIICQNIYSNIDIVYYGKDASTALNTGCGLKYDIIVKPGGNPNDIKIQYQGTDGIEINNGQLKIKNSLGEMTEAIPRVYQNINGKIIDVKTKYVLTSTPTGEAIINFSFSIYNSSFPLVVDPWATYYGGSDFDAGTGITTDNTGNVIACGKTYSTNFPVSPGAYQTTFGPAGIMDAYVVKFNPAGARSWATYYGGTSADGSADVATDNTGNIFFTGYTASSDFPLSPGAYQTNLGSLDAFVVTLLPTGIMTWATYYGGSTSDDAQSIATDNSGNVFITGSTYSSDFPVLNGCQMVSGGGAFISDAFVVKFDPIGTPAWATYYGGSSDEFSKGIAIDNIGNVVITGHTQSSNFPTTVGAYQTNLGGVGFTDAFVVKFTNLGALSWATYYGGSDTENGKDIVTDNFGNIIITGYTLSVNFPVLNGYQMVLGGGQIDVFLSKFNTLGVPVWSTFYGGTAVDYTTGVATDANSNIYLYMEEEEVPTVNSLVADACSWQPIFNGGVTSGTPEDQLVVKFTPAGQKLCATFMGGTDEDELDYGGGIAVYGNSIYITGETKGGYPVANAFQTNYGGGQWDAFVASLCTNICEGETLGLSFNASDTTVCLNALVSFSTTVTYSCDTSGYQYLWTFTGGNPSSSSAINPSVTYTTPGSYTVKLLLTTSCKADSIIKNSHIVVDSPIASIASTSVNCNAANTGSAIASVNPGTGTNPYTYLWNTSSTSAQITQLVAGVYSVTVTDATGCSSIAIDTIIQPSQISTTITPTACNSYTHNSQTYTVSALYTQTASAFNGCDSILFISLTVSNSVNTTGNQNICQGQSALIHGINQSVPGVYTQTFTTVGGCDSSSAITLSVTGIINTVGNQNICERQTVSIHGISQSVPGLYTQTFTASTTGCDSVSAITLNVGLSPIVYIGNDTTILAGQDITFSIATIPGSLYQWSNGSTASSITQWPTNNTTYILTVTDSNGCSTSDTVNVLVTNECDNVEIFVPNSFSPNDDGQNDVLRLYSTGTPQKIFFAIYDRWGEKVFESNDFSTTWDGKYKGATENTAVYTYLLKVICKTGVEETIRKGNISLLR